MNTSFRLGLVLLALATVCRSAQASTILGPGEQSVIAQALFADLAVTSVALDQNPDAGYFFTYQGSTVGTSWSGSLTGQFLGIISNGSLSGSIIPDSTNIDPTWMIDSGTVSIGGTPYALSGTLGFDAELNGSVNFTAKRTTGTATTTINWTNVGNLTTTANANPISTTFAGTLMWNQSGRQAANYEMAITISPPLLNELARITSTITKDGKTQTINQGKLTITKQTSFDSTESIDISSVPEPSSLMLLTLSMVALVGYRRFRLRIIGSRRMN